MGRKIPRNEWNKTELIEHGVPNFDLCGFDIDYFQFSRGYEHRILGVMKKDFPDCVFLSGWIGDGTWNMDYLESIKFEFNDKGTYILNEDDGNTEYMLSVIGPFANGVIFKGRNHLKEFNELEYCSSFGGEYSFDMIQESPYFQRVMMQKADKILNSNDIWQSTKLFT